MSRSARHDALRGRERGVFSGNCIALLSGNCIAARNTARFVVRQPILEPKNCIIVFHLTSILSIFITTFYFLFDFFQAAISNCLMFRAAMQLPLNTSPYTAQRGNNKFSLSTLFHIVFYEKNVLLWR
jgi:hypothetical protein